MAVCRPPRAFVAVAGFVLLVGVAAAGTGMWVADPLSTALLFVGVGVALPEASLVLTEHAAGTPMAGERALVVVLAGAGYATGHAVAGRPVLVGAAATAGALVAEGYVGARRAARAEAETVATGRGP